MSSTPAALDTRAPIPEPCTITLRLPVEYERSIVLGELRLLQVVGLDNEETASVTSLLGWVTKLTRPIDDAFTIEITIALSSSFDVIGLTRPVPEASS